MNIYIDKVAVDTMPGETIKLPIANKTIRGLRHSGAKSFDLKLPMIAANRRAMGDACQVNAAKMFNAARHTIRFEKRGCLLFEGITMLAETVVGSHYLLRVRSISDQWQAAIKGKPLSAALLNDTFSFSPAAVESRWGEFAPIQFFPAVTDGQARTASGALHPFVNVAALMEAVFRGAGYAVRSDFMAGEFFRSLYISGRYAVSTNLSKNKQDMDFLAGNFANKTAIAGADGKIYAKKVVGGNMLGNLADTANPLQVVGGVTVKGVFNTNNAFRLYSTRPAFVPVRDTIVGFEYSLSYITDYRIRDRNTLACFDTVDFGDGQPRKINVANTFRDYKAYKVEPTTKYLVMNFDYDPSKFYKLVYYYGESIAMLYVNNRGSVINIPNHSLSSPTTVPSMVVGNTMYGSYTPYKGDWALYMGWVTEQGSTEVSATVQQGPTKVASGVPFYLDNAVFSGAWPAASMTLLRESVIRPVFDSYISAGQTVNLSTIACHDITQSEFVTSLGQMFNLGFQTDTLDRTIRIEPMDNLTSGKAADWRGRHTADSPTTISETIDTLPETIVCRYSKDPRPWRCPTGNPNAANTEEVWAHPSFASSESVKGAVKTAPDAYLPQVDDLTIVAYHGMAQLPNGQRIEWDYPASRYPLAAFHLPSGAGNTPYTLSFDDRDGRSGLKRFHIRHIERLMQGRKTKARFGLLPHEIESLPEVVTTDAAGESALFTIEEAVAEGETTLCTLLKL